MEGPHRRRVLVVEDRSDVRALLLDVLALIDCEVDESADGSEGLARFSERPYDVVVTDLLMPGMTGWELTEAIRRKSPEVPVILVSGSATEDDIDRARAEGFVLLRKPIAIAEFIGVVQRFLDNTAPAVP